MRRIHEALELLAAAARLPLSLNEQATCARLTELLAPATPWTERALADLEDGPVFSELGTFLVALNGTAQRVRKLKRIE